MLEDLIRSVFNAPPSQRRIKADIDIMREDVAPWSENLFPWVKAKEIGLLSLNHETKIAKHTHGRHMKGVYYSIYDEPMMVFGHKKYSRRGKDALLWASSKRHEFIYRMRRDRTDVFIDREAVGYITENGLFYGGSGNRLLGRRNDYSEEHYSVVIWDKEVAHLAKAKKADRVNTRAFELLEDMSVKEELLLIAIGFLTLMTDTHLADGGRRR